MSQELTKTLENKHRVIAKVVGAAPVLADRLAAAETVAVETLRHIVEFMRIYADQCHHGKEEALLFPALAAKGVPTQGCPIGGLSTEHTRGRALIKALADACDAYEKGDPAATGALVARYTQRHHRAFYA